jgi:hypothetical protein
MLVADSAKIEGRVQENKATWRWCDFLGNVSVTMYDLI